MPYRKAETYTCLSSMFIRGQNKCKMHTSMSIHYKISEVSCFKTKLQGQQNLFFSLSMSGNYTKTCNGVILFDLQAPCEIVNKSFKFQNHFSLTVR